MTVTGASWLHAAMFGVLRWGAANVDSSGTLTEIRG